MTTSDAALLAVAAAGLAATVVWILYVVGRWWTMSGRNAQVEASTDSGSGTRHDVMVMPRKVKKVTLLVELMMPASRPATTRREIKKEQKRQEREQQRKFEEYQREEARKREEAIANAYRKKALDEAQHEKALEEAASRLAEAAAAKEAAEFAKWKGRFAVEGAGSDALVSDESSPQLQDFIEHITTRKVVVLEDLAAAFGMSTAATIQRIEALLETNRLSGLLDDRGKFIAVSDADMDRVAAYIRKKGRVSVADLARECNRILHAPQPSPSSHRY
ncbi:DDRGK domain-containing protein 1-like [Achlya hypogyna]|uniref:DDRGK domain-containing protein 1-like n=1 Tax=Achlya hypogyna TaxID=1202772 RepID=A0A1V9YL15_ACHHY|nr:DDRGK domain-containing protein 1-like [Achlya hypogyna]